MFNSELFRNTLLLWDALFIYSITEVHQRTMLSFWNMPVHLKCVDGGQIFFALNFKIRVFWYVMPCCWAYVNVCFKGLRCTHFTTNQPHNVFVFVTNSSYRCRPYIMAIFLVLQVLLRCTAIRQIVIDTWQTNFCILDCCMEDVQHQLYCLQNIKNYNPCDMVKHLTKFKTAATALWELWILY